MTLRVRSFLLTLALLASFTSSAHAIDDGKILFPKGANTPAAPETEKSNGLGATTVLGALVLAGGGAWLLVRSRSVKTAGRDVQSLAINETRPLGNRQYLVVASYEGKKFLLGVCPGRIDLLSPLSENNPAGKS